MYSLGLSAADKKLFEEALVKSHKVQLNVFLLDHDEKFLGSLTAPRSSVLEGDVQIDNKAKVKRSLNLTILDPDKKLQIEPDSPADQAVFVDNFVAVEYCVWVGELGRWIDVPVFWGPVTILDRQEELGTVHIEAVGKEFLVQKPHPLWATRQFPKGKKKTLVIQDIMEIRGEAKFDFSADLNGTLPKPLSVSRKQEAWKICKKLAQSMNKQFFYNGRGMLVLRPHVENVQYLFEAKSAGGAILSSPDISYDVSKVRNTVEVLGHKNDNKKQIRAVAYAGKNHPLSPYALRRNEQPRYIVETIKNEHIKRVADAKRVAVRRLRKLLRAHVEVTFESLCIPHLEEADTVALKFNGWRVDFAIGQMTLPLTDDSTMSINFLKTSEKIKKKNIIVKPRGMKHHGGGRKRR